MSSTGITVLTYILGFTILGVIGFFAVVFPILSFIHIFRNPRLGDWGKLVWAIFLLMTWMVGAIVYGVFRSGKLFYQVCAVLSIFLLIGVFLIRGPLADLQEKQKLRTPSVRLLTSSAEWAHLRPILKAYGMHAIDSRVQAGQCEEAQRELEKNLESYIANGAKLNATPAEIKKLGAKALDLCERMK